MSGKKGRSGKRHEPTPEQRIEVAAYAKVGVPHHDIAILLEINLRTLLKMYARELAVGKATANAEIAKRLYNIATTDTHDKQLGALIYWTKSQMGWREVQRMELGNVPGETFRTNGRPSKIDKKRALRTYEQMLDV